MSKRDYSKIKTPSDFASLLGMAEGAAVAECIHAGYAVRISSRDGVGMVGTRDHRNDRINLHLADGKVVAAALGLSPRPCLAPGCLSGRGLRRVKEHDP
jgi:hypothetical protein